MTTSSNNGNKPDLSDKYTEDKNHVLDVSLSPLDLFHKLSSKCIYPINPINCPVPYTPPPPAPDKEPKFTPADERLFVDFYCSRPYAERLTIHRRAVYLRADRGWPWDTCFCQAYREGWLDAGCPSGPFKINEDVH